MRAWRCLIAGVAMVAAAPASADTVTDWWDIANRYFNAGQGAPGPRTPDMERASTRTALAMFEAVNAIDRRYQGYLNIPVGDPKASQDAAAATAAYKVLLHHYPANKGPLEEGYALEHGRHCRHARQGGRDPDRRAGGPGRDGRRRARSRHDASRPIGRAPCRANGSRRLYRRSIPIGRR